MERRLLVLIIILFVTQDVFSQEYQITAFGTDKLTNHEIRINYGETLDSLISLYDTDRKKYNKRKSELEEAIKTGGSFGYVDIQYFKSYSEDTSIIIDFVEREDMVERMNFKPSPTTQFTDPDSLIAKWHEYAKLSFRLYKEGEITDMNCPVIHCTWSFNHPLLAPYLNYLIIYAPPNREKLIEILTQSDSSSFRSASALLLAHIGISNQELVDIEVLAINDPVSSVRNNSMRVIYYAVRADSSIQLDIGLIIKALGYPSFTDRNKALVILRSLPLAKLEIEQKKALIPLLMEIIEKKDAHNYRNAYLVLKNLSGNNYLIHDLEGWQKWEDAFMSN